MLHTSLRLAFRRLLGLFTATLLLLEFVSLFKLPLMAQEKLGLGDRRALKEYQDTKLPALQKAINEAAGFAVTLDVDWNAIARIGEGDRYNDPEYWTQIYFQPLAAALKKVAVDDMGKKALKAGLKKVVITFDERTAPASNWPNGLKFDNGTFTINFTPFSNAGDESSANFKERVEAMVKVLESKL
jgi:hypothetical protein